MKDFAPGMMIRHKIWLGYGLLVAVLAVVSISAWYSLRSGQDAMEQIVKEKQPAVLTSLELTRDLERTAAGLGLYLLSQEPQHRDNFEAALEQMPAMVQELSANPYIRQTPDLAQRVARVQQNMERLAGFREQMLELADNPSANLPAMAYATQEINPLSQQILQLFSQMLLSEVGESATPERKQLLSEINELRYAWTNVMSGVRAYLAFRGENSLNEVNMYLEQTGALIERIQETGHLLTFEQEDSLAQFLELRERFIANYAKLQEIHGGERWRTDAWLIRTELGPLITTMEEDLNRLGDSLKADIRSATGELHDQLSVTETTVLTLMVAGILFGILGAWTMVRLIAGPLKHLADAMKDIAEGDGDLTHRLDIHSRDEIGQLADAFNSFAGKIHDVVRQVKQAVTQLAAAAEEMSVITSQTRDGVARQQAETDQVASAMTEMNATAHEVSRSATDTASATEEAHRETRSGREVVDRTVKAMQTLAGEVERAAGVIRKLEQDSASIGSVMKVIRDIADQTNLLALNAAIEAARAGEQGRGFAVVADEVRTLASRTQDSTQEIDQVIKNLQEGAQQAVKVMEASRDKAKSGVEQAGKAGTSLASISSAVDRISEMSTQIASAAEEQSAVSEEINRNVVSISDIAGETATGAGQLAGASEELAGLAAELQGLVGRFRTAG